MPIVRRSPRGLIRGIEQAVALGPANTKARLEAANHFTLDASVTTLLRTLAIPG